MRARDWTEQHSGLYQSAMIAEKGTFVILLAARRAVHKANKISKNKLRGP
jgi:hypothetical protein